MDHSRNAREEMEFLASRYVDGTLEERERLVLEARLDADPQLARWVEQLRALNAMMAGDDLVAPQLDWNRFEVQVRTRRKATKRLNARRSLIFKFLAPMAVAASILFVVWLMPDDVLKTPATMPGGAVEIIARFAMPHPVPTESDDSFVSCVFGFRDLDEDWPEPESTGPVFAQAAVGEHVRWPTVGM